MKFRFYSTLKCRLHYTCSNFTDALNTHIPSGTHSQIPLNTEIQIPLDKLEFIFQWTQSTKLLVQL